MSAADPTDDPLYENLREADFRLTGTVVTYDGEPCYIHEVREHEDGTLRLCIEMLTGEAARLGDTKIQRKLITSRHFNRFRPVRLGFMNYFMNDYGSHASYCVRVPLRRSKQGLCDEAFNMSALVTGNRLRLRTVATSRAFREMIMGVYPTFEQAMELLTDNSSIAVDRDFAIVADPSGFTYIYHRTDKVGLVNGGDILLRDSHAFLREAMVECPNLPNNIGVYSSGRLA